MGYTSRTQDTGGCRGWGGTIPSVQRAIPDVHSGKPDGCGYLRIDSYRAEVMSELRNNPLMIYDHLGRGIKRITNLDTDISQIARIFSREDAARRGDSHVTAPFSQNPWVQAVINQIAIAIGEIPFGLYRPANRRVARRASNVWIPVENHPLLDLFDQPNRTQNFQKFITQWTAMFLVAGNVWAYKDAPNSRGVPRALLLFGAGMVQPIRKYTWELPLGWQLTLPNGSRINVPLNDMIHWSMPNPYDPTMGLPPWWAARTDLDADAARSAYDRYFFKNNATPDAILTYKPGPLNEYARSQIYEAWAEYHQGIENVGGLAVVGGDFDLKVLGVPHTGTQFLEIKKFTREEIASLYNYPVALLNAQEHTGLSRDGLEVARTMKYENAVIPHSNNFANGITDYLVHDYDRNMMAAFDYDILPVMVTYLKQKMDVAKQMFEIGIPLNSILAKIDIGINPIEGGDKGLVNKNLIRIDTLTNDANQKVLIEKPKPPGSSAPPRQIGQSFPQPKNDPILQGKEYLSDIYRHKMTKFMKDMRTNAFKHTDPSDPQRYALGIQKWTRWITPVQLAAITIGMNHRNGALQPSHVSQDSIKDGIHKIQVLIDSVGIKDPTILEQLESLMKKSSRIVGLMNEKLSSANPEHWDEEVNRIFDDMERIIPNWSDLFVNEGIKSGYAVSDFLNT